MSKKDGTKNYRPNVAAIILSSRYPEKCELMVALRNDIKDAWQFPQGGIDADETPEIALFRELKEEIGTDKIEIVSQYPGWLSYDFPRGVAKKMYPYDGQMQKYFLVRLKSDARIDLKTKHPEFSEYKFVDIKDVFGSVTQFKKAVYKKVINYFRKEGYL
jgi:putative (di)nucleoside polyphosphate hydrolase